MSEDTALSVLFRTYLNNLYSLSPATIYNYQRGVRGISRWAIEWGFSDRDLYEIRDVEELQTIWEKVKNHPDFETRNGEHGHRMYSTGMRKYLQFACGEDFRACAERGIFADMPIPVRGTRSVSVTQTPRSDIVRTQAMEIAGHKCELDGTHVTFPTASTGKPYMEGHHAIPLRQQPHFENCLDVYANIVCLCPNCHRFLHYGIPADRRNALQKIYADRADRLCKSGISLSQTEFLTMAGGQ